MKKPILLVLVFFTLCTGSSFSAYVGVIAHIKVPEDMPAGLQVRVGGSWNFGGGIKGSYATSSGGAETLISSDVVWTPGDETVIYTLGLNGGLLYGRTVQIDPYFSVHNNYSGTSWDEPFSIPHHFPNTDAAYGDREIHVYYYIDSIGGATYPEEPSRDSEDSSTDEPIDTKNGNNYFTEKRISVPCPGVPLEVDLMYQSVADLPVGSLGEGWRHSLEWALDVQADQAVLYTGSGDKKVFGEDGGGGYFPPDDKNWTLEEVVAGYEVGIPVGLAYIFDTNGVLSAIHDAWGNRVECSYGTNGCLESANHSNGRQIVFSNEWHAASGEWRVDSISAQGGLSLVFDYNSNGQFTQVVEQVEANSYTSRYRYAEGFLTNKVNVAGFEYTFGYETGTNSLLNGKGTYLDVDGYYEHEVGYVNPDATDVRYFRRGTEQVYRYSRNVNELLTTKYGPGESISDAMTRGVEYSYAANNEDKIEETLFNGATGATWSEWTLYDSAHNVTNFAVSYCSTNPAHQLSMEYDPQWQLPITITDAEGSRVEIVYTNGSPSVVKAFHSISNSYDTCFSYATNGLVTSITNANERVISFSYDGQGNLTHVEAELGPVVTNTYDTLGFLKSVEILSENGASTGRITQYDGNTMGWVEQIMHPDGLMDSFAYNALGYLTNTIDRAGHATSYTYAPTEALTSISRYLNEGGSNVLVRIGYDLDEQVNLLHISEPRGRYVESYKLDIQDRVTSVTNIESQVISIDYSVGGFVTQMERFDGTAITNTYDNTGRKTSTTYLSAGGQQLAVVSYSNYADGTLKTISDGYSSITHSFDRLNRLTNVINSVSAVYSMVDYKHDPVGNITNTVVDLEGSRSVVTAYSYDTAERLTKIGRKGAGAQGFMYGYSRENGRISSITNSESGIVCSYAYDLMDRATNITYRASDGSLIRGFGYEYNAASMMTEQTVVGDASSFVTHSYVYDSLDRLVHESSSVPLRGISYSYDLAGNRMRKTENGRFTSYVLGAGNRYESSRVSSTNTLFITGTANELIGTDNRWGELWMTNLTAGTSVIPSVNGKTFFASIPVLAGQTNTIHAAIRDRAGNMGYAVKDYWVGATGSTNQTQGYMYDSAGCLTNLNGSSLEWDERYRLKSIDNSSSFVEYEYDVRGRRVSRIEGLTTNLFVYDGIQVAADLDGNGDLLRSYVWGIGIDNLMSFTDHTTSNAYYAIKDHQNSVIAMVDDMGSVIESYDYDAYGNTKVFNASGVEINESIIGNRYCFQGREIDWSTGLYYFRARWYNPETGRWLSKDPIGISGGLNQYEFCRDNPANFNDPTGLDVAYLIDWDVIGGAGHGAAAVGNDDTGWTYYSFGAGPDVTDASDNLDIRHYKNYQNLLKENSRYDGNVRYSTNRDADRAAHAEGISKIGQKYNLFSKNCDDIAVSILRAAGINAPDHWMPFNTYRNLPLPCSE